MNKQEVGKVLAKIQIVDNRQVDALTISEWYDVLEPFKFDDAVKAVTMHRRRSADYMQPAHVVEGIRRLHAAQREEQYRQLSVAERTRLAENAERARLIEMGVLEQ